VPEYWGEAPHPTLTAVGVTWLYGFKFEIKVIAKLPPRRPALLWPPVRRSGAGALAAAGATGAAGGIADSGRRHGPAAPAHPLGECQRRNGH
jgi:hypothetical protein